MPATFFEVGIEERYFYAATAAIVARGYPIGDHTEPIPHVQLHAPSSGSCSGDRRDRRYGAPFPRLFRPPYGLWNATTLALLQASTGC